jgi:hypothetical protein
MADTQLRHLIAAQLSACDSSGVASGPGPAECAEAKLASQSSNESIFCGFHTPPRLGIPIIVVEQMQQPVNDVADQFALPGGVEAASLAHCFVKADDDFAVKLSRTSVLSIPNGGAGRGGAWPAGPLPCPFRVVKGDHIGGAFVSQESLVEARHLGRGYEANRKIEAAIAPRYFEQGSRDPPQEAQAHIKIRVSVVQVECPLAGGSRLMALYRAPVPFALAAW